MNLARLVVFLSLLTVTSAILRFRDDDDVEDAARLRCGTRNMDQSERRLRNLALAFFKVLKRKRGKTGYEANSPKVVPICFHVVGKAIPDRRLQEALDGLNTAFSQYSCCDTSLPWCEGECSTPATKIEFVMAKSLFGLWTGLADRVNSVAACRTWSPLRRFTEVDDEEKVKKRLHVGDSQVLNIYITDIKESLGYAYFPETIITTGKEYLDGVVINRNTLVGGSFQDFNLGKTLAHEVGHWLGLEHTFEGGCDPGDYIGDTPAQASPNSGCEPIGVDTCPGDPGLDPIHNYMDYSDDECLYEWTQGQVDLMHATLEFYRSEGTPNLEIQNLTNGILSPSYSLATGFGRQFRMNVPGFVEVACRTVGDSGDVDLYMSWDDVPGKYECASEGPYSEEYCKIEANTGTLYVWVLAARTTASFSVQCTYVIDAVSGGTTSGPSTLVVNDFQIGAGALVLYEIELGGAFSMARCDVRGDGDADLMMGFSRSVNKAGCSSFTLASSYEECSIGPYFGNIYVWLSSWSFDTVANLNCNVDSLDSTELVNGVETSAFSVARDEEKYLYLNITVPSTVECKLEGFSGDADLFMAWSDPLEPECKSQGNDNSESCSLGPNSGYAFAAVYGFTVATGLQIVCTAKPVESTEIANAIRSGPYDVVAEDFRLFALFVPYSGTVHCTTGARNGDVELFMNWDGSGNYDCMSETIGPNEACSIGPNNGTAYAYVFGYETTFGYTIECNIALA